MEKQEYKKTRPLRYVYHVSHSGSQKSILEKGLLASFSSMNQANCLFAHNSSYPDIRWYPFCFYEDFNWESSVNFDSQDYEFMYFMIKYDYDFWQIDTWKIDNEWFIDKYGMQDFYKGISYPFLIFTNHSIPKKAIRRFCFHNTARVSYLEGAAHVEGYFRAA